MEILTTEIPEVVELQPRLHRDARGALNEVFRIEQLAALTGAAPIAQENLSESTRGVLRGLHYQVGLPQSKLVRCVVGEVFDVAVDARPESPTFGQWVGRTLRADARNALWVPPGFAHGFLVLSETALVAYSMTDIWRPESERALHWQDPQIGIAWPLPAEQILVSEKDAAAPSLESIAT